MIDFSDAGNARAMGKAAALMFMADVMDESEFRSGISRLRADIVDASTDDDLDTLNALWDGIAEGLSAHSDPESLFRDLPTGRQFWLSLYRHAARRLTED